MYKAILISSQASTQMLLIFQSNIPSKKVSGTISIQTVMREPTWRPTQQLTLKSLHGKKVWKRTWNGSKRWPTWISDESDGDDGGEGPDSTVHFIIHQISLVTWVAMMMKSIQCQTVIKVISVPVDQHWQVRANICRLHNVCDSSNSNTVIKLTSLFYVTSTSLIDFEGVHDVQGDDLHMDSVIRADNTTHDTSPTVRGG